MVQIGRGIQRMAAACALLSLCGCGGGGSGAPPPPPPASLTLSPTSLYFVANGPADATPAPQPVAGGVTGLSSGTLYIIIVGTGPAIASISSVSIQGNTGAALVSVPSPISLGVGSYSGTVTVHACVNDATCATGELSGSPKTIAVTYDVAALQSSAASFSYLLNNSPTAADTTRQATITGIPAQSWTAVSDVNWLTVTAAGANGAALSADLVQAPLDALSNGTYTGHVTLTPGTAGQPLVLPVSLTIQRTQINYVSPYVAYAGTAGSVVIRGEQLSQVTVQGVTFGGTAATAFTVISPTEIDASYPASLAPGRYTVQLQSTFAGVHQLAELVVVNPPTFTAAALSYPDPTARQPVALVYDAERAALAASVWYSSTGATSFISFPSDGTTFQAPTSVPIMNHYGLALTADGTEWIAGAYRGVTHINAADLSVGATIQSPIDPNGTEVIADMSLASDGTIAMYGDQYFNCGATLLLYNPRARAFTAPGYTPCRGNTGASADGSRVLLANPFAVGNTDDILLLDTTAATWTATGIHLLTDAPPALDRTGSRMVLNRTAVYDGSYQHLGDLPATTNGVVLSPDGTRAYAYDQSGLLLTYDISAAAASGSYTALGTGITLIADPGLVSNMLYVDAPVFMAITPDGKTVFIAGTQAVVVQPVP